MALSNSVLRRYTPPTCTLEIIAKSSPLSRWMGQAVLKDLRFELRFDDPRKSEDKRVTIQGDRTDLETLCDAVNSYVQGFLDPSSTQLPLALHSPTADLIPDDDRGGTSSALPASGVTLLQPLATQAPKEEPEDVPSVESLDSHPKVRPLKPRTLPTEIYLKPRGLLSHNLFLGQLANEESGPVVDLSVLQLFDLATALDEYTAEVLALPNLNRVTGKKAPPAWTWAAIALVTVGVTTAGVRLLNRPEAVQQATRETEQESNTALQTPTSQLPATPITPLPVSPLPTPAVPAPLSASPVLPPPSPVAIPTSPAQSAPSADQRPALTITPPPVRAPISTKRPAAPPGAVASSPAPATSGTSTASGSPSSSGNTPTQTRTSGTPTTPFPLPNLPPIASRSSPDQAADSSTAQSTARSGTAPANVDSAESAPTENTANSRLSDVIPQVREARNYLLQRWQPPSGLAQTLEYSLLLNADGSIQRIVPLGKAAGDYINSTTIPRPGEPFVSAVEGQRTPKIRVILTPEGEVQTFLESMN